MLGCGLLDLKEEEGGRGRGIYPTWASGVYLTGGGVYLTGGSVYLTKVVSCYPFPIFNRVARLGSWPE